MLQRTISIIIVLLIIVFGAIWLRGNGQNGTVTVSPSPSAAVTITATATASANPLIEVTLPHADSLVTSPLTVTGQARGTWFFEGQFPIRLVDATGKEIARGTAQAKGEWMTEEFVPFEGTLTFSKPSTTTGSLIAQKDNPSGLPQNDQSISIPVRFQ